MTLPDPREALDDALPDPMDPPRREPLTPSRNPLVPNEEEVEAGREDAPPEGDRGWVPPIP